MNNQKVIERPEGKTQDLFRLTVQIRKYHDGDHTTIIGTGFAVDREKGLVVTCRHVVEEAISEEFGLGARVWVYFDQVPEESERLRLSHLYLYLDSFEDDVVVLRLEKPPLPVGTEIAVLGDMNQSVGYSDFHRFRSFGYRKLEAYQGLPASGKIIEFTHKPEARHLLQAPVMLESSQIDTGMSGAPVLDLRRNLIVGVINETWDPGRSAADRDTSFAVDAQILSSQTFNMKLCDGYSLPLDTDPPPGSAAQEAAALIDEKHFPLVPVYYPAEPELPKEPQGQTALLRELDEQWLDPSIHVTGLIGLAGEGKRKLAYRWLTDLQKKKNLPQADGLFWWNFQESSSIERMVEAATTYLYGEEATKRMTKIETRIENLGAMIAREDKRILFVLEGLEAVQEVSIGSSGEIKSLHLKRLLQHFTSCGHRSFCLIMSSVSPLDLMQYTTYSHPEFSWAPYVNAMVELALGPQTPMPLSVGIFAEWGAGKSTFLRKILQGVKEEENTIIIEYITWPRSEKGLTSAGFVVEIVSAIEETVKHRLGTLQQLSKSLTSWIQRKHIDQTAEAFKRLKWLHDQLDETTRIIIAIDDLDRCCPDVLISILEGINLILASPLKNFVVFAVMDYRMSVGAIEKHFEALDLQMSGESLLKKVFSMTFAMPGSSLERFGDLVLRAMPFGEANAIEKDETETRKDDGHAREDEDVISPDEMSAFKEVLEFLPKNPREVKRLILVFRFVMSILARTREAPGLQVICRWLAVTIGWTRATNLMLERFQTMSTDEAEGKAKTLLLHLWQESRSHYMETALVGADTDLLERLLNIEGGWMDRRSLEILRDATPNLIAKSGKR